MWQVLIWLFLLGNECMSRTNSFLCSLSACDDWKYQREKNCPLLGTWVIILRGAWGPCIKKPLYFDSKVYNVWTLVNGYCLIRLWLSDLCAAETDEPWAQGELAKDPFVFLSTALKAKAEQSKSGASLLEGGMPGYKSDFVFAWAHWSSPSLKSL